MCKFTNHPTEWRDFNGRGMDLGVVEYIYIYSVLLGLYVEWTIIICQLRYKSIQSLVLRLTIRISALVSDLHYYY